MQRKAYIKALSSYLPQQTEINDLSKRLTKKTGICERHIAGTQECASDMAVRAAEQLFSSYDIERESIDFVILCTQSPDYFLPTTACLLQDRLGLPHTCGAFDFNLGCSGYIYGLSIVKGLIETGQAENILLITAETYSKFIHAEDATVRPLFGDAAVATLVCSENKAADGIYSFSFGTNGSGANHLIVPAGAARNPYLVTEQIEHVEENGNRRTNYHLFMDGGAITNFALEVVPPTVNKILQKAGLDKTAIDYYVFHQANKFMLEYLQQKCELQELPYWNHPEMCGNTVSCSIPLALTQLLITNQHNKLDTVMLVGFGVGLSWGGCLVDLSQVIKSNLQENVK